MQANLVGMGLDGVSEGHRCPPLDAPERAATGPRVMDTAPTREEFWSEVFETQVPTVWRQAAVDHPMVQLARGGAEAFLSELSLRAGHNMVTATSATPNAQGRMGFNERRWVDWASCDMTLSSFASDVLRELRAPTGHCTYLQSATIREALPELTSLSPVWIVDDEHMLDERTQLWIGSGGQRIPVHRDESHSFAVMVAGAKEFTLFPPDELPNLYTTPRNELAGDPLRSAVDPRHLDYDRYPRFKAAMASARTIRLEPGDVLFLPTHWWHTVDSFGFNVMMNSRWFDLTLEQRGDHTAGFAHAMVTARTVAPVQAQRFRQQLREHLFLDAGTAAREPRTREALKETLREAVAATRKARPSLLRAPDVPLRLSPHVTATIGTDAVELRRGHVLHFLEWAYLPLLNRFTAPVSPRAAIQELSQTFDFETTDAIAQVRELVENAILVPEDPQPPPESPESQRARVDVATAHIALQMASFPKHHLRAFERTVETFAFRIHGDPYPHLPAEEQGMLGSPMSAEVAAIFRDRVRRNLNDRLGRELLPEDFWTRRYRIAPGQSCTVSTDGLAYEDQTSGTRHHFGWGHLELLAHFREPCTPTEALEAIRDDWNTTDDQFRDVVASMVVAGTLVAA